MTCRDLQARMSEYLDGLFDEAAAREAAIHLDACPGCRRERDALSALFGALKTPAAEPSPLYYEALPQKVSARLASVPSRRRFVMLQHALAWSASAALLLVCTFAVPAFWDSQRAPLSMDRALALSEELDAESLAEVVASFEPALWDEDPYVGLSDTADLVPDDFFSPWGETMDWSLDSLSDDELDLLYETLSGDYEPMNYS